MNQNKTVPIHLSRDVSDPPAELVSEAQYPEACREASIARSEKVTVREIPAQGVFRRCTPPEGGIRLSTYMKLLDAIARSR